MQPTIFPFLLILALSMGAFYVGRFRIEHLSSKIGKRPQSPGSFYGMTLSLWCFVAGLSSWYLASRFMPPAWCLAVPAIIVIGMIAIGTLVLSPRFHARLHIERVITSLLLTAAFVAVVVTATIFFTLLLESIHFFTLVPVTKFLFGTRWAPATSLGHTNEIGDYGVLPLICGTLLITVIAMVIAVPLGLLIAIYTAEYATPAKRKLIKPVIEMLAGVPTIIYGFFALIAVAPLLHHLGQILGLPIAGESALGAGLVMGLMIVPFISSLADDALNSVPKSLRENSWALGATSYETILKVVVPAAFPGIASSVLLAFSRAIGETMLVVMAAGLTAHLTLNPLQSVTTITVQIVALLTGDQEFNSPKTLSAFALGLLLFTGTLILNIIALKIMRWHREKYAS